MAVKIPSQVSFALDRLNLKGFEAYIVGGCVRDSLLGKKPVDWDVTTSALPDEILETFKGYKSFDAGIKHGTVTVIIDGMNIEITTFRVDGKYTDNRHPDSVRFTPSLKEDLSRRDFTVNAFAYSESTGIIDYFGGQKDLANGIIKCVGEADRRFNEDALRLLRALRFSSALNFSIEYATAKSIRKNKALLSNIAAERISAELTKLLCGDGAAETLLNFSDVFCEIIPELVPSIGFNQNNPHHIYTVYEHCVRSVNYIPPLPELRLAMLFHDIAKPDCYSEDKKGVGHFYGHPKQSCKTAKEILKRLKYDNCTINSVCTLIEYHDASIEPTEQSVKRWLGRLSEKVLRQLLLVKAADNMAQNPQFSGRLDEIKIISDIIDKVVSEKQCFSLKDLELNGNDLIALGCPKGKIIGEILDKLLDEVINGVYPNDKAVLSEQAVKYLSD